MGKGPLAVAGAAVIDVAVGSCVAPAKGDLERE